MEERRKRGEREEKRGNVLLRSLLLCFSVSVSQDARSNPSLPLNVHAKTTPLHDEYDKRKDEERRREKANRDE